MYVQKNPTKIANIEFKKLDHSNIICISLIGAFVYNLI